MTPHTYCQPKGGMCATCQHFLRDCSTLPFYKMPAISTKHGTVIVRCTEYVRAEKSKEPNK